MDIIFHVCIFHAWCVLDNFDKWSGFRLCTKGPSHLEFLTTDAEEEDNTHFYYDPEHTTFFHNIYLTLTHTTSFNINNFTAKFRIYPPLLPCPSLFPDNVEFLTPPFLHYQLRLYPPKHVTSAFPWPTNFSSLPKFPTSNFATWPTSTNIFTW